MSVQQNMGPFAPVTLKGGGRATAVPVFVDKLPLTIGGVAGPDNFFGRVVSFEGSSHRFYVGNPAGTSVIGVLVYDPLIAQGSPAKSTMYFEDQPATAVTVGLIEISEYITTLKGPTFGSKVVFNNTTGEIGFLDASDAVPAGYTAMNAGIYDTNEPNGTKIWISFPIVAPNFTALDSVEDPVTTPAAGAVPAGTLVTAETPTPGAVIRYTLDGTTPTMYSPIFPQEGISVTSAVTVTLVALKEGMNPSAVVTAAYTIA